MGRGKARFTCPQLDGSVRKWTTFHPGKAEGVPQSLDGKKSYRQKVSSGYTGNSCQPTRSPARDVLQ